MASERQIKDEFQFVLLMSDEGKGLPSETIRNLYSSLPRRMANIIELDGRMTRYQRLPKMHRKRGARENTNARTDAK